MPVIIGVKFKNNCKIYYFDPAEEIFAEGDSVVVDTAIGLELGTVAQPNSEVEQSAVTGELKKVLRKATEKDIAQAARMESQTARALQIASEKVAARKLNLKLVDAEYSFDGKKVVLFFTADGRIDFRDLVKDLASALHARIELRQIYERDDTKKRGALGICGRECCCKAHLPDFEKVSIKMAKVQGLSLNPAKISGVCGKLMCCLKYENDYYSEVFKLMPKVGSRVNTPDGSAIVAANDMIKKVCTCKLFIEDTFVIKKYPLEEINVKEKQDIADIPDDDNVISDELEED